MIVLIHTQASAPLSAQRASASSLPRDASLELFQELYKYKGRIGVSLNGSPSASATEATFLCQLLFLQFLAHRAPARLNVAANILNYSPKTFYRDALQPLLRQWFPTFQNDELEIDSRLLYDLFDSFAKYQWDLSADSIQPWLLGYVYERWINQRESGSYFTPDLLAYNIAQLAIQEWLATQAETELGTATEIRDALRNRKKISTRAREWLCEKLDTVRTVDLSMGGGGIFSCGGACLV